MKKDGKAMKIGWVIWDSITPGVENASSRIRALWVQKYMPGSKIITSEEQLMKMDGIIFQKRFTEQDVLWAELLKNEDIPMIFDVTDPEWNYEYMHYDANKQTRLSEMIEFANVVTVPTEILAADCRAYFPHKKIVVIKDRVDLSLYQKVKEHKDHKPPFTIFWHGCTSNTDCVRLARGDLERLSKEFKLKLVCCYGPRMDNSVMPVRGVEVIQTDWSEKKCTDLMLEADVSINPRWKDIRMYKSDNKTIKALACGVPCVDRDFYRRLKGHLNSVDRRNAVGRSGRHLVETYYDSKQSVAEYIKLFKEIQNPPFKYSNKSNSVAVVSCITASTDNLIEDQNTNGADFIMFTDNSELKSDTWHIEVLKPDLLIDPRRQSRMVKWLIHKYLYEYEYTLWLDGNVRLLTPVRKLINMFLRKQDITVFWHKDRNCVYSEADDCISKQLDDPELISRQMARYRALGYPPGNGLSELPAILRKHTKKIATFNEAIWAEYCTQTRRDQLCFDFVAWQHSMQIARFPGKVTRKDLNIHFEKIEHIKQNRSI